MRDATERNAQLAAEELTCEAVDLIRLAEDHPGIRDIVRRVVCGLLAEIERLKGET